MLLTTSKRRLSLAVLLATLWSHSVAVAQTNADRTLSAEEVAKLRPEICSSGSSFYRAVTGALPFLAGSTTRSMSEEQLALIDGTATSARRKVWVLRLPAAFITRRTCDSGRQNYTSEGPNGYVNQDYQLSLLLSGDKAVPLTTATPADVDKGIQIQISLRNQVTTPSSLHRGYHRLLFATRKLTDSSPAICRDEPSDIADLVRFRRVDPKVARSGDCEDGNQLPPDQRRDYENKVYAKKLADLTYEFIAKCNANCAVYNDFNGWGLEYSYAFSHLKDWQQLHGAINKFLSEHTAHQDREDQAMNTSSRSLTWRSVDDYQDGQLSGLCRNAERRPLC